MNTSDIENSLFAFWNMKSCKQLNIKFFSFTNLPIDMEQKIHTVSM